MPKTVTIGLIGLDTSHVPSFTKIFNDPTYEFHIPGFKVTHGFPGASADFELSSSRVEKFTQQVNTEYGVTIVDSPQAVAKEVDIIFINAVDGRAHLAFFEKIAPFGKPTFIDKPFAATLADAQAMAKLAADHNIPLTTCSSLRFADRLTAALKDAPADDPVMAVQAWGPMNTHEQLPGLLWYGVHAVEMIIRVMGPGIDNVRTITNENNDVVTAQWADGRVASYNGLRNSHSKFGLIIHRKASVQIVDASTFDSPWYFSMLTEVMAAFAKKQSAVPMEDSLAVMEFIDAANRSRTSNGQKITCAQVNAH